MLVDDVGRGDVLDCEAGRVEDGDAIGGGSAGPLAGDDFAQLAVEVVTVENPATPRDIDFPGVGALLVVVDDELGIRHDALLEFVLAGGVGAHCVDVGSLADRVDGHDRVLDRRHRREDVAPGGLLDGACPNVELPLEAVDEPFDGGVPRLLLPLFDRRVVVAVVVHGVSCQKPVPVRPLSFPSDKRGYHSSLFESMGPVDHTAGILDRKNRGINFRNRCSRYHRVLTGP